MIMHLADENTSKRLSKSPLAFRTISEVANELNIPQHVLRFWEAKFSQIKPTKRGGGRRYYRPEDITLLRHIRGLLYDEGYTIKGAQKLLKKTSDSFTRPSFNSEITDARSSSVSNENLREQVRLILSELQEIRKLF